MVSVQKIMQFAICNYKCFWKATMCFLYTNWFMSLFSAWKY